MNRIYVITSAAIMVLVAAFMFSCQSQQPQPQMDEQSQIERGEYLVTIASCNDCHTPKIFTEQVPVPDTSRLLSGHPADEKLPEIDLSMIEPSKWYLFNSGITAAVGPWGVSYAINLTPDENTGIGLWTEEMFIKAMRTGKHLGEGRPILPPMPWQYIGKASDEDLKAMFTYLKTLKPIQNQVPQPIPLEDLLEK